jgi:signal transduction histidine kinase
MTGSSSIRALIVDDDPGLIGEFRRILSASGTNPPEADGWFFGLDGDIFGAAINHKHFPAVDLAEFRLGQDAVEAVRDSRDTGQPFSIAFVDMQLNSGLDGVETAERIRALDAGVQIAVIASRNALHPIELVARVPPADRLSYLKKPFHPFEVQHLLLACVHRRRVEVHERAPVAAGDGDFNRSALRAILDRLPVGILIFDRHDQLIMANAEISRQFAETAGFFVPGIRYDEIHREFNAKFTAERDMFGDRKIWRLRGHRWVIVIEEVTPAGQTYCLLFDVTDFKARESGHWHSEFSVHMTQTFSTLCATIYGLLADKSADANDAEAALARLRAVVKQQHLSPHAIGLSQYMARSVRRIRRRLPAGVGLEAVLDAGLWLVNVDSDGLARALAELTANACEAMPKGGRIIVEATNVRLKPDSELVRTGLLAGDYVRISVQDTGQGMSQEWAGRAIMPFQSRRDGQHLGLGLTIVHAFAIESGGWLSVDGGAGSGTIVYLFLPKLIPANTAESTTHKTVIAAEEIGDST